MAQGVDLFDLSARITADTSAADRGLTATQQKVLSLAKQFEATELAAKKSASGMAVSMAAVNAEIGKMKIANLSADYDKFANALRNNSVNSRKAADDFLNLLSKVSGHSKVTKEAEAGTHKLSEALRALSSSAVIAEGPMGGIASRLRAMGTETTELGGLLGPGGIIVGGLVATAGAAVAAGVALFEVAEKSAELGHSIFEIHEKTNLTTESISAFRIAAEQAGIGFETVGNKLTGFNVALGKAQLGNKEMIKTFQEMGVDIRKGVEPALEQFVKRFAEMGPTAQRNALEAKIFRDRTGDMIPVLLKLGTSLEEARKNAEELGLSFTEADAKAADEFTKTWRTLELQFKGIAVRFSKEYMPQIVSAMTNLSQNIKNNQDVFADWGRTISDIFRGVVAAAHNEFALAIGELAAFGVKYLSGAGLIIQGLRALGIASRPAAGSVAELPAGGAFTPATRALLSQGSAQADAALELLRKGAGAGGGRSRGTAKHEVDDVTTALQRFDTEIKEAQSHASSYQKQLDNLIDKHIKLGKAIDGGRLALLNLKVSQLEAIAADKRQAEAEKKFMEDMARAAQDRADQRAQITARTRDTLDEQTSALARLKFGEESNLALATKMVAKLIDEAKAVGGLTQEFKALIAAILKTAAARDQFLADQKTKGFQLVEKSPIQRAAELAAAAQEQDIKEKAEKLRQRIQELAGQLTSTIDRAISDGFSGGVKKGLATLLQGLLDMIKNILLKQLEARLVELLTKISIGQSGSSGGGGLFSKLFGALLSGLLGGLAGGAGGGFTKGGHLPGVGGKAGGGLIFPGEFALVGEAGPELAFGGTSGLNITPNQSLGGGNTFVFNIRTPNPQSFMGRETQSQITRRMRAALTQQSLAG